MLKIGLTGGIASGKSTCAAIFAELGAAVHDADVIAKELLQPSGLAYGDCLAYFGPKLMQDRVLLREYVFANDKARTWLNAKLHPLIQAELAQRAAQPTKCYHLLVIPLLFENNFDYGLAKKIAVLSKQQQRRAVKRDQVSIAQIQAIMALQVNDATRREKADYLINTDLPNVLKQVQDIHANIMAEVI